MAIIVPISPVRSNTFMMSIFEMLSTMISPISRRTKFI